MRGSIAISEDVVKYNNMGWSVFDFFKHELKRLTSERSAGWYAYRLHDGIYYFYWCVGSTGLSSRYLLALKEDGFTLGISPEFIK